MHHEQRNEERDHYMAADLSPELVERLKSLEEDFRSATNKDVILIAYEDSDFHP